MNKHTITTGLAVLFITTTAGATGIPVVGGPVNLEPVIESLASNQDLRRVNPELAAVYAEMHRQYQADAYNRKKADDLKRARAYDSARGVEKQ